MIQHSVLAKAEVEFEEIRKFEADLELCTRCGFCTFWCPVYREERVESAVARGKNMMIRSLLAGNLGYSQEFADRLSQCTLCMACAANCPVSVHIPDVIVAARADTVKARGISFPYNIIYHWLLPHRRLFGNVVRLVSFLQGIFLPKSEGTIRHLPLFLSALGRGRNIPQIAPKFLRQILPVVNRPPTGVATKLRVGYFTGCMTDFVFSELGKHVVNFLTRNGVEVVVPKEQGCCGAAVFLGAGDFETGRRLADSNLKAFEGIDYVITDCATCTSSLKDYVRFLADTPERKEAYAKFGNKVKDISEFLVDILKLPASIYQVAPEVRGKKITWHDPCHLSRHLEIKDQPRQIIKSIPGVEYIEMPDADSCCGMAGTFSIYYYELSKKIADKKIKAISSTGADIVVSSCHGCELQLIDGMLRNKMPVKVMHLMELLR